MTKLVSWNVNGLRAVLGKGLPEILAGLDADLVCLQETKARAEQVDVSFLDTMGYRHVFFNSAEKPGYSGTAIFSRAAPLAVNHGMGLPDHDREGRVQHLEFPAFHLVNVYTPNAQDGLRRLPYRVEWDAAFREFLSALAASKPVVFGGDLNVAHEEIDLARPRENRMSAGFSDEERAGFRSLLDAGFADTFREIEKGPGHYSWWSFRGGARARNVGWRIDYWGVSRTLLPRLVGAGIRPDIHGSDHCPVWIDLDLPA